MIKKCEKEKTKKTKRGTYLLKQNVLHYGADFYRAAIKWMIEKYKKTLCTPSLQQKNRHRGMHAHTHTHTKTTKTAFAKMDSVRRREGGDL